MSSRFALKLTTEYLANCYRWQDIPLQYLVQFEQYSKTIRKIKIKLNTVKKGNSKCATSFNVYKLSARSSAG
tara:strand:+ start:565 stop:780 length:216 start_codon:yes stop_codon:yes gene_type:complete